VQSPEIWVCFRRRSIRRMFSKIRLVCFGPMSLIGSRHWKLHPLTPHLAWPPHYSSARPHSSLALPPTLSVPDLPAPLSPPGPWQMEHRLRWRWRWRWRIRFSFPSAPQWPPVEDRRARGSGGGAVRAAAAPWWSSRIPVAALRWRSSRGSPVMHSCMCLLHLLPLCCSVCSCVQSIPFPTWSRERRFHPGRGSAVQLDFTDTDAVEALRGAPGMPYGAWLLPVLPLCTYHPHLLHHVSHPLSWCGIDLFDWFNLLVPGGHRFRVWWCDVSHPVSWCGFSQLSICRSGYACSHLFIAYYLITKALIC